MITHLVMFKFPSDAEAEEARARLLGMAGRIPGLLSVEAGVDFTKSERSFHLGLITHHSTRAALEEYQSHPVHQEVAAYIRGCATASAAVDFETP